MSETAEIINDGAGEAATVIPVEDTARRMGWKPKEEYKGAPDRWKPADEFVRYGLEQLPVAQERLRVLDERYARDVGNLQKQVKEIGDVLKETLEFNSRSEQRAYERAMKDLEAKRAVAVAHADTETFNQTQAEIDALNKEAKKVSEAVKVEKTDAQNQPTIDPYVHVWLADNPWYSANIEMGATAETLHKVVAKEKPNLSMKENLAEVRAKIVKMFPEHFENSRRSQPSAVSEGEGGAAQRGAKRKKGYADLPEDAKRICDKYVKTLPPDPKTKKPYTREDYCAVYFKDEE
ncbi:MAG: hypothetical protein WDN46_10340 [Methylocella sp.]